MEQSRLNLKLPKEIKDYLSEKSWRERTNITQYLIMLIEKDMNENKEIIIDMLKRR